MDFILAYNVSMSEGQEKKPKVRQSLTVRLSDDGQRLLGELARKQGISRTAVLELLIRQDAEKRGVE